MSAFIRCMCISCSSALPKLMGMSHSFITCSPHQQQPHGLQGIDCASSHRAFPGQLQHATKSALFRMPYRPQSPAHWHASFAIAWQLHCRIRRAACSTCPCKIDMHVLLLTEDTLIIRILTIQEPAAAMDVDKHRQCRALHIIPCRCSQS